MRKILFNIGDDYSKKTFLLPPRVAMRIATILERAHISYVSNDIWEERELECTIKYSKIKMKQPALPEQDALALINQF